jgi:hypothetical protein
MLKCVQHDESISNGQEEQHELFNVLSQSELFQHFLNECTSNYSTFQSLRFQVS